MRKNNGKAKKDDNASSQKLKNKNPRRIALEEDEMDILGASALAWEIEEYSLFK